MDNWSLVIGFAIENLPADVHRRSQMLEALAAVIPNDHPHTPVVLEMLRDLLSHLNAQRELFAGPQQASRGSKRLGDRITKR